MSEKWCGSCHEECDAHIVDNGIGHYEFWGATGVHSDVCYESECCDATVYDDPECRIEADMPSKDDDYDGN